MAVVAVLATMTACGGSASSAGFASGGSTDRPTASQLLKLARCMRAHGVPNFPDPTVSGGGVMLQGSFDFGSPQFWGAERACGPLVPAGLFPSGS